MNHEEFGTSDDYIRAFGVLVAEGIPHNHLALLRAHYAAPNHTATWAQLAEAIGYANGKAVNLQYGTFAGRVAQQMGIAEVPRDFWLDVLAGWAEERDVVSGHTSFILRDPVIEALTRLGVLNGEAIVQDELHAVLPKRGRSRHQVDAAGPDYDGFAHEDRTLVAGVPRGEIHHVFRWSQVLTSDQYIAGFERIASGITELQRRILESQYYSPRHTAYATQLAQTACVQGGHSVINLHYGKLGRAFMLKNGYAPDRRSDGSSRWWSAFSLGHHTRRGFIWEMLPEVARALECLGWVTRDGHLLGDESLMQEPLREGAMQRVEVNVFERNPVARRLCIEHYGPSCAVCDFDFRSIYGPVAEGFILVHHVVPLAHVQQEYVVDPVRDLRPVCANCHAIIHLGRECRTVEQVRDLIQEARRSHVDQKATVQLGVADQPGPRYARGHTAER